MGYGRYNSSYSSYGGGGGYSSSYGGYATRGSSMRSSAYGSQSSASRNFSSHTPESSSVSQTTVTASQAALPKPQEQKSSAHKATKGAQKTSDHKVSTTQPTSSKSTTQKSSKQSSKQKSSTQKNSSEVSGQKMASTQQVTERDISAEKSSIQQTSSKTEEAEVVVEEHSVAITFTEGSFHAENMAAAKNAKTATEVVKTAAELQLEKEQLRKETKQKDLHDMELQVTKHPKFLALQEKLNARITTRQEANKKQGKTAESKIKPPTGHITYGHITIKNTASFLELSLSNEEGTLKTLEDIHDLLDKEFLSHNICKVEAEIGKFLLVSKSLDDMLNLAMIIQIRFNEHKWDDMIINLPMFRKLLRPEDLLSDDAVALFNGPRISIGIHCGEAKMETDSCGKEHYSGDNIIQVKTIGKFAQGGQILVSSGAWTKVNQSKLSKHIINRLGVFKLENFSSGCSLVEVVPEVLQERTKFYGSVCSHCAKGIQPWEKSYEKHDCMWHEDHFKCFSCNENVSEGAYATYQGLPHCHKCYLASVPKPKCKKCTNNISKEYINALGTYWHTKCYSCRQCSKRASPSQPLFEYKDNPYCQPCHKKLCGI